MLYISAQGRTIMERGLKKLTPHTFCRLAIMLVLIFGGPVFIIKNLTPSDYVIHFKRECDGTKCEKIKSIDSERGDSIKNEIEALSSALERIDFFTRFTFLRFNFEVTNKSQFLFVVTEPRREEKADIKMLCNLHGQGYILSPNAGIIFKQKSSVAEILKELERIQNILISCELAPQKTTMFTSDFIVAAGAQIQWTYDEEKYHLKFLPDRWNYILTVLQMFILIGLFFGAYEGIRRFVKDGIL